MNEEQAARGLGWFSIGLGAIELLAARPLAKWLGSKHPGLIRLAGVRDLAAGTGILVLNKPKPAWLWARVGGNTLDLAALALTYRNNPARRKAVGFSLANGLVITALDIWFARQLKPYKWPISQS